MMMMMMMMMMVAFIFVGYPAHLKCIACVCPITQFGYGFVVVL
jgi:hypothetical protein